MARRAPLAVALYGVMLRLLLPREIVEADGDEMRRTFADLHAHCTGRLVRAALTCRCLLALAGVALLEHLELRSLSRRRRPQTDPRPREKNPMIRWTRDFVFALRTLRRAPGFTAASVLLLALGVGGVTGIFTLFDNILLRPLPYPDHERLAMIEEGSHSGPFWNGLQDLESVDLWAAAWTNEQNWSGEGDPQVLSVGQVSEDFFRLFGARPTVGRLLSPDDFDTADRVVLSHDLWVRQYGGDESVVGETIRLDEEAVEVVGVVERSFSEPTPLTGNDVDLWRPMDWSRPEFEEHGFHVLQVAGRLAPGATAEILRQQAQALVERLDAELTEPFYRDREENLWQVPVTTLQEVTVRGVRVGLNLLLAAVGLLLLIACSNVAHLSVARGLSRRHEMSLRRALGARTFALVRQLLAESLVVAMLGGLLGLILAAVAVKVFLALNPEALPRDQELAMDLRVVLFAAGISAATAMLFGLLPALQTARGARAELNQRSATEGRRAGLLRSGLVAVEVALSLILLVGAGVLLRSFGAVTQQETGIETENVWRVPLTPSVGNEPEPYIAMMKELREEVRSVPGVSSATVGLTLPFSFVGGSACCWRTRLLLDGQVDEDPGTATGEGGKSDAILTIHPVGEDYFSTLGIDVVLGSVWQTHQVSDTPAPVALPVSTASGLFGSAESALGQTMTSSNGERSYQVVAVVSDVRHYGLDQDLRESLYLPLEHLPFGLDLGEIAVRTEGPAPTGFARSLRQAIWRAQPNLPVPTVMTMEEQIASSTAVRRFDSVLFSTFGGVALLLAGAGLYGTLLYSVGRRRREMGIRMALGAARRHVEAHILRSGAMVTSAGIVVGLLGAWATTRFLESRIWGVEVHDPAAMVGATVLLTLVAFLACWLPARRAGRTDPVETLRAE